MLKRLFGRRDGEPTAAKQEGDAHALDRPGDPRGGVQSDEYRHAQPDDLVEEGDVAMGGPGGAPQEDETVEERRERDRPGDAA
ncbi:MAG TPA: hypothetical protein VJ716_10100 [Gaiellaceae bacterium]|nr:hypothetical protein [Gaiellaceae bacterium]